MGYYLDDNGNYVLTDFYTPPPRFLNVTAPFEDNPGRYIVGQHKFVVRSFTITNIFNRQMGKFDEVILGIFTVFLIAIFADLIQTVLLRVVRDRRVFANNLVSAALIDEVTHMRNIWYHVRGAHPYPKRGKKTLPTRHRGVASIIAVSFALLLFVAEVVAVILTQPKVTLSTRTQYNLKGVQPAGTFIGMSKFIRRTSSERGCVPPRMAPQEQQRNFHMHVCFTLRSLQVHEEEDYVSDVVEVGSWYHRGGSDHNVTFGNAFYNVQVRAELFSNSNVSSDTNSADAFKIFFENRDNDAMDHAHYVQRRFILASLEWSCNQDFSERTCLDALNDMSEEPQRKETREIKLWRGKTGDVTEQVQGLVTRFKVKMNAPFLAVNAGIRELMTSAAIEEVEGLAKYQSVLDDAIVEGLNGLLSEEGRIAGVLLILTMLICFFIVLLVLRYICKPVSLALVAIEQVELDEILGRDLEGGTSRSGALCRSQNDDTAEDDSANCSYSSAAGPAFTMDVG